MPPKTLYSKSGLTRNTLLTGGARTISRFRIVIRVGGAYRFCMRSPEGEDHWVSGVYHEIVEPERIVKTWLREYTDGTIWCDTLLTLLFKGVGEKTIFRLHQTGFESAEHRDQHRGGWSECLDRLEKYVTV